MSEYGFKTITMENWREPDPVNDVFVTLLPTGFRPTTIEDRVGDILESKLSDAVPLEVRRLYEVARGAMVYGTLSTRSIRWEQINLAEWPKLPSRTNMLPWEARSDALLLITRFCGWNQQESLRLIKQSSGMPRASIAT